MMNGTILTNKRAVLFGAGGALGSETAKRFVELGADVYASSRSVEALHNVKGLSDIRPLDTLDENAVDAYMEEITKQHGPVDIVINFTTTNHAEFQHGHPAAETTLEELLIPARTTMGSQFVTAKAAHKYMAQAGTGTILFITSTLAKVGSPWSAALSATHAGIEGLMKSLACEWGSYGIRVLGVRSEAMPETPTINYTFNAMGQHLGLSRDEMQGFIETQKTALGRLPATLETANVLAIAASDFASYMTGTMLNHSGGHILE